MGGGGSGIHYSLKIKPIIHLIKLLGLFIIIRPIIYLNHFIRTKWAATQQNDFLAY